MKYLFIVSVHGVIWSSYTLSIMLSQYDRREFELMLLLVFVYFAYLFAKVIGHSSKASLLLTVMSLGLFQLGHVIFNNIM